MSRIIDLNQRSFESRIPKIQPFSKKTAFLNIDRLYQCSFVRTSRIKLWPESQLLNVYLSKWKASTVSLVFRVQMFLKISAPHMQRIKCSRPQEVPDHLGRSEQLLLFLNKTWEILFLKRRRLRILLPTLTKYSEVRHALQLVHFEN